MTGLILLFLTAYLLIALIGSAIVVWAIVKPHRKTYAYVIAHDLPAEPSDIGQTGEEVIFNLPGRHTTPGWVITGNNPAGPTVLVLHGHRDFTHGAMRFVPMLAPFASSIVLFDWPGHGGCTAPWMTCGKREPSDVLAVLQNLPDTIRNKPIVLFGYSLGAQIAIKTAGLHDGRFAGVMVDGPYRLWDTPVRLKLKHLHVPSFPFVQLAGLCFWMAGLLRDFDRVRYAKNIQCPLLVLHGSEDRICPIHEGQAIADAAPNSTFVAVEGGRHNRLHEQAPEQYAKALQAFFQAVG